MTASGTPLRSPRSEPPKKTIEEWLAVPEEQRAVLIDGRLVYQAMPGPRHGRVQASLAAMLQPEFDRRPGDRGRVGGWWLSIEVDMDLGGMGCRPDLLGWRREKQPVLPQPDDRGLVTVVPDWIAEVLSPSTAAIDLGAKRQGYERAKVPYYWLVDPSNNTITVLSLGRDGYLLKSTAGKGEKAQLPPFDGIDIDMDDIFPPEDSGS